MKIISTYSLLGLNVLLYLTDLSISRRVNITQIAQHYRVSYHHMNRVVSHLNRLGYIKSCRGRNGGIVLNKVPMAIKLGDLIQLLEEKYACCNIYPQYSKKTVHHYRLDQALSMASKAFFIQLNEYTIVDLVIA